MYLAIALLSVVAIVASFIFGALWGRKIEADAQRIEQSVKAKVQAAAKKL